MSTGTATLNIKIDTGRYCRAIHDTAEAFRRIGYLAQGKPSPPKRPYPKSHSLMTAREYRAARRAYARALRAHRKAAR